MIQYIFIVTRRICRKKESIKKIKKKKRYLKKKQKNGSNNLLIIKNINYNFLKFCFIFKKHLKSSYNLLLYGMEFSQWFEKEYY